MENTEVKFTEIDFSKVKTLKDVILILKNLNIKFDKNLLPELTKFEKTTNE